MGYAPPLIIEAAMHYRLFDLIMEFIAADDRTGPPPALIFAVNMLVHTETGDTFRFAEVSQWLREAGIVNPRLLEVPTVSPLVLAARP